MLRSLRMTGQVFAGIDGDKSEITNCKAYDTEVSNMEAVCDLQSSRQCLGLVSTLQGL